MNPVNLWLALRDDAQAAIKTRLQWDEDVQGPYTGPVTNRQFKFFRAMSDQENVEKLFRLDTDTGRDWTIWTIYFSGSGNVLQRAKDELDQMLLDFPAMIRVVGAWHWDGRMVGTQWVDPDDHGLGTTGTPTYPLHSRILELMPDVVTYTNDEPPVEASRVRPTVPSDVNMLFGQMERRFA